ncbi:site-specific integrase [Candidatus Protochlamydia amoebophila]|nr:site-specific integrase [Candidatus Protochlamydia amoebophila]
MRDKALLLLGFVGAFRRSELVSLTINDIKFVREGLQITLRKSKTDQEGKGRVIAIPYGSNILTCPVRALNDWLNCSKISEGPLFRPINRHGQIMDKALTSKSVALIIKRNKHLEKQKHSFSGHSLRAGFATTAAISGVPEHLMMKQTGHKSSDTIRRYIRLGNMWTENTVTKIGL